MIRMRSVLSGRSQLIYIDPCCSYVHISLYTKYTSAGSCRLRLLHHLAYSKVQETSCMNLTVEDRVKKGLPGQSYIKMHAAT